MQVTTDFTTAIARKYPEGVAIAIARDDQGRHNPITLCWLTRCSFEPPMLALSVGQQRHTLAALRRAGEFVVCLPSVAMEQDALFFGSVSGRDIDKLAQSQTATQPAREINSVLLSDAVANFECKLEREVPTGDHVLIIGRVVAAHINSDPTARPLYALGNYELGGVMRG